MSAEREFSYASRGLSGGERRAQRWFEIVPGAACWGLLAGFVVLAYFRPVWGLVVVVAIDLLVICYACYSLLLLLASSLRLSLERDTDWMARVRELDALAASGVAPKEMGTRPNGLRQRLSNGLLRKAIEQWRTRGEAMPPSEGLYQVAVLPVDGESRRVLERAVCRLREQSFPPERLMVILAIEARASTRSKRAAWEVHREHHERFLALYVAPHSADESASKDPQRAANLGAAARMAIQALREREVPLDRAILTCLDPQAEIGPHYLAGVAWHFMSSPNRTRASFQPVAGFPVPDLEGPAATCVLHMSESLFRCIEANDPARPSPFFPHSLSCGALDEVGFWPADLHSGDASIFWKCYLHFSGDYRLVAMPIASPQSANHNGSFLDVLAGGRLRRLAWESEDLPIVMRGLRSVPGIPRLSRFRYGWKLLCTHVAWSTGPVFLLVLGWLPGLFAAMRMPLSTVSYYSWWIHCIALALFIGLFWIAGVASLFRSPATRPRRGIRWLGGYLLSWLALPLFVLGLRALAALKLQTRMVWGNSPSP